MTKHIHGGDVYKYDHCLDFSANCNPLGTPQSVKQAIIDSVEDLSDYPRVGCGPLKEAIADYEHTKKEYLICASDQKKYHSPQDRCCIKQAIGTSDILHLHRADSISYGWFLIKLSEIVSIACKLYLQRTCHCCLCLCRVGAGVISSVSAVDLRCIFHIHFYKCRGCHHQPSLKSGWNIIGHIIQFCSAAAKIQIFIILITQHGIHGIDSLVKKHQPHSADCHIKHRCYNTV